MLSKKLLVMGLIPLVRIPPLVSFVSLTVPIHGKESNFTSTFFKSSGFYHNDWQSLVNGNELG
jgi:hypothetical protein